MVSGFGMIDDGRVDVVGSADLAANWAGAATMGAGAAGLIFSVSIGCTVDGRRESAALLDV
jgi:hypothetical protein